jgi:hypothetical protein
MIKTYAARESFHDHGESARREPAESSVIMEAEPEAGCGQDLGLAGFVLKSHYVPTAERAACSTRS